jgi:bifunctional DNase/RNase
MTTVAGADFVEMRVGKVVGLTTADGDRSCCVVLDAVSQDRRLPIWIGQTGPFHLSAAFTGVEFARPVTLQFAAGVVRARGGRIRRVRIGRLVPAFGGTVDGSTVEVESSSGAGLVEARPSGARNHVALRRAPIFVAQDVLAGAEANAEGDSRGNPAAPGAGVRADDRSARASRSVAQMRGACIGNQSSMRR